MVIGEAFNEVSLSINAAHTTDGGLAFGGGFTMGAATELEFDPYTDGGAKFAARMTVDGRTNIAANLWNVSGGGSVAAENVVSVKINSAWLGIDQEQEAFTLALGSFTSSNICKLAGRGDVTSGGRRVMVARDCTLLTLPVRYAGTLLGAPPSSAPGARGADDSALESAAYAAVPACWSALPDKRSTHRTGKQRGYCNWLPIMLSSVVLLSSTTLSRRRVARPRRTSLLVNG